MDATPSAGPGIFDGFTPEGMRKEFIDTLAQSWWLTERATAQVLSEWGGQDEAVALADRRAALAVTWMERRDVDVPHAVLDIHSEWTRATVGATADEVPGGPMLNMLVRWIGSWCDNHLAEDGCSDLRPEGHYLPDGMVVVPVDVATRPETSNDHVFLESLTLPEGPRIVVLNDTHIGEHGADRVLAALVKEINTLDAMHVFVAGDITESAEWKEFDTTRGILEGLNCPYTAVLGNHDVVPRSSGAPDGGENFRRAFGYDSGDIVIDCGETQVVLLDSADPTAWKFAMAGIGAVGVINGALKPGQAEALAARLDPSRPVFLVMHHGLQPFAPFPAILGGMLPSHSAHLLDCLSDFDLQGVAVGHTHRNSLTTVGGAIPQLELPAMGHWPWGYSVISCASDGTTVTTHQVSDRALVAELSATVSPSGSRWAFGPTSTRQAHFPSLLGASAVACPE